MIGITTLATTNTFEGVLLFIIALVAFFFLFLLKEKTKATWLLIAFFGCMALLGLVRIFDGTVAGAVFGMLQDALIILGGLFLVQFAYHFPQNDQPREARFFLLVYVLIVLLALGTILMEFVEAFRSPHEPISLPEYFWYLMPLAILLAIILSLRRALHYSGQPSHNESSRRARLSHSLRALVHPPNNSAAAQRNLALAIALGAIQAFASIGLISGIWATYAIGIGGLLVVGGIALVYYSHSLEPISFTAKLVGISLTALLIYSGIDGINSIESERLAQNESIFPEIWAVRDAVVSSGDPSQAPVSKASYLISWPAPNDYELADLGIHYLGDDTTSDTLDSIQGLGGSACCVDGHALLFAGIQYTDFFRERFIHDGRVYEIGFSWPEYAQPVLDEVNKHVNITIIGSLLILILFPFFFRRHLFNPLSNLLQGVRKVDEGQLDVAVPVAYEDEIGTITRSFNKMTQSLVASNQQRDSYSVELENAYEEMEQRIADRTQALTEANRELQIAKDEAEKTAVLEERQRLARDLHDAITQSLYGVMLFARASRDAQEAGDDARLEDNLLEIETNSLQTLKEMRLLLHQLRPLSLEYGGLSKAIDRRFDQVERRLGIIATAKISEDLSLSRKIEESLYFIMAEALNNSLKHGNAREVRVCLDQIEGDIQLIIEDNGQGFDQSRPTAGMGLSNMQDRAHLLDGEIEIWTEDGKGTRVTMTVPHSEEEA